MIFDIKLVGQTMIVPHDLVLASGARETVKVRIKRDEAWEGLTLSLTCRTVFLVGIVTRTVPALTPDTGVVIPAENLVPGALYLGVTGYGADGQAKLTTGKLLSPIEIRSSEDDDNPAADAITPAMAEQLLAAIGSLSQLLPNNRQNLVSAINELYSASSRIEDLVNRIEKDAAQSIKTINRKKPNSNGDFSLSSEDLFPILGSIPDFNGSIDDALDILATALYRSRLAWFKDALENFSDADLVGLPVINRDVERGWSPMQIEVVDDGEYNEILRLPTVNRVQDIVRKAVLLPSGSGFVKSVNGEKPDADGNVNITILGGGGGGNCPLTVETITIGEVGVIPVTGIELDYSTMSINEGESFQLAASVLPENATNNVVGWRSSNNSIATVTNGYVTGVSGGTVAITAYSLENNAITATCNVTVSAESGGGSTTDGKIMLADVTPVNTGVMLKKDGKTEYAHSSCYGYCKIPYTEGMLVSTVFNKQYAANYPPVMVIANEIVTQPTTESVVVAGSIENFTAKITGYSENAQVIVNISNIGVIGTDTNWDKCYYIAGGEE